MAEAEMEFLMPAKKGHREDIKDALMSGSAVAVGVGGSGIVGHAIEKIVKNVTSTSTVTDKVLAWVSNNVPKLGLAYGLGLGEFGKGEYARDMQLGALGSIILDTFVRLANNGINDGTFFGQKVLNNVPQNMRGDIQRVLQENGALRSQLNQALQRLASTSRQAPQTMTQPTQPNRYTPMNMQNMQRPAPAMQGVQSIQSVPAITAQTNISPMQAPIVNVTPMQTTPEAEDRRRQFGAMVSPPISGPDRRRRYGAMESTPPIIGERDRKYGMMDGEVANMFGML